MGSLFDISTNSGVVFGYFLGYECSSHIQYTKAWRVMLGLGAIPPLFVLISCYFIPESPRWLVMRGKIDEAKKVLISVGDLKIEETLKEIIDENEIAQTIEGFAFDSVSRSAVLIAVCLGLVQQIGGSEALLYYTPKFLKDAGMTSQLSLMYGEIAVGLSKLSSNIVMSFYVDTIGRRKSLILSSTGVSIIIFIIIFVIDFDGSPWFVVVLVSCYMISFGAGQGLITWVVATELLPNHVRTQGMVLVACVNRLVAGLTSTTALTLVKAFGYSGFFSFYFLLSLIPIMFYVAMIPETSKKSLEFLAADFREQRKLRKEKENEVVFA